MRVLITGGLSGLGWIITNSLLTKGHEVLATYCSSATPAEKYRKEFQKLKVQWMDFTNADSVKEGIAPLLDFEPDVLIHNAYAGGLQFGLAHKIKAAEYVQAFQENVWPVLLINERVIPYFRSKSCGNIIFILSDVTIHGPSGGLASYSALKNYLLSLVKSLALENKSMGITINAVSPGFMDSEMTREAGLLSFSEFNQRTTASSDVAEAVIKLAENKEMLSGQNIPVL